MTHTPAPWAFDGLRVYSPAVEEQMAVRGDDGTESGRGLIALVYSCGEGSAGANGPLIAAAPAMLKALHDVWVLAETLDIGTHERTLFREAVSAALDAAEGRAQTVTP
jgi:hypothetical protein